METAPTIVTMPAPAGLPTASRFEAVGDRLVRVIATYQLTENGRKASLLSGGDGHALQQVTMEVLGSRLHLVSVDTEGVARLKLRPHYALDAEQRIVRTDGSPTYDALPTVDDLLKDAARNHQLERAYLAERTVECEKRREVTRELREHVALEFLGDQTRRALAHPPPTPQRCEIMTPRGRLRYDIAKDDGDAKRVPPEAHRRFRSDLRAKAEQRRQKHAEHLAIYEEKKRAIAEWVATRGTPDQQARHAAGALPSSEVVEAMADEAFAPLAAFPRYALDGAERLQAHLRRLPRFAEATVAPVDLMISVEDSKVATEAQWVLMHQLQRIVPHAALTLRAHRLGWKRAPTAPTLTVFGLRVKLTIGPFVVVREYAAPE